MPRVHTNPDALRRVAAAIESTDLAVSAAISSVHAALDQVHWDDHVRRTFDGQFDDLVRAAQNFHRQAETSGPLLRRKAAQLDDYLRR